MKPVYNSNYTAKDMALSVNDYSDRDYKFDTLFIDSAYIHKDTDNLDIDNAYITDFAVLKNNTRTAAVENQVIGLIPLEFVDMQLYTTKTGIFSLGLDKTINMHTSAPTVYNNPHMLVNGYHSAWNFVNRGFKEVQVPLNNMRDRNNTIANEVQTQLNNSRAAKAEFILFDLGNGFEGLSSNANIYSISTVGAVIENIKGLKKGQKTELNLNMDGIEAVIQCRVTSVKDRTAQLEFIDMPRALANKLLYRYMQANSEEVNLTAL